MRLLLENFANIKAVDWLFGDALKAASSNDHELVVMLLLECGADINSLLEAPGEPVKVAQRSRYKVDLSVR